jgi:hypothetical protein
MIGLAFVLVLLGVYWVAIPDLDASLERRRQRRWLERQGRRTSATKL